MNIKRIFSLIGIILFLNGCAMIPKYSRPKSPVPGAFPGVKIYADNRPVQKTIAIIDIRWEDIFPDQKLKKVIGIALLNNRDLRLAMLNVERSRALYGIQQAGLFPSVTASGAGSKTRIPADLSGTGKVARPEKYSVDLGIVAWEVDLFGRIRSLKEQALQEYLGTEQVRRAARVSLISEVARAYITLAADLENLILAQTTLETQRSVFGIVWQQYDKGLVNESDLRRSQAQVETAVKDIARYTQLMGQDRNALDLLCGTPVPEDLLPFDLAGVNPFKDISPGLSSEVLLRRPDIMAAEHQLKAANAFIGAARAAFFPKISLTTAIGSASSDLSNLLGPGSRAWTFAGQTAMPIFDARTYAAYRVSKAQREISLAQYEKSIQVAFREVADTIAMRDIVDQQVAAQESIVESARKIYELTNQRYIQGIDGYLSVLDAQRSLYAAQQELTYLRLAKLLSQINLYAVLGGDGKPQDAASNPN